MFRTGDLNSSTSSAMVHRTANQLAKAVGFGSDADTAR